MSSTVPVLYDAPGPRARRRAALSSVLIGLVLIAVLGAVVIRLADQDQFSMHRWGPLINPSDEQFRLVWQRLGKGLGATLIAAVLAITLAGVTGTVLGVARMMAARPVRVVLVAVIELLRGLPVIIQIFIAYRVLPQLGVDVGPLPGPDGLWYLVIGLTTYNSVIIAEILRTGVGSLPRGQREAALANGFTNTQTMRIVLLPQAFRAMLPALISQLVVILKDTSLAALLALYLELLRQGLLIKEVLGNPLQTLFVVAVIYILINFSLSRVAVSVQRRLARGRRQPAEPAGPLIPLTHELEAGRDQYTITAPNRT